MEETPKRVGIIGGGQLGKMLIDELLTKNVDIYVMDPNFDCPCAKMKGIKYFQGDLYDKTDLCTFSTFCDVMTYEIEHVNCDVLLELERNGKDIRPSPKILKIIQNKYDQKTFLTHHNFPTVEFSRINRYSELNQTEMTVLKSITGGYDGKGVIIIDKDNEESFQEFLKMNNGQVMYERYLKNKIEISVLVARDSLGNKKIWPVVEMVFDDKTNMLDYMFSPSKLSRETQENAVKLAESIIGEFFCF